MNKRERLAQIAETVARKPFHGRTMGLPPNISVLTDHFPRGPRKDFVGKWCAAFVYHCCIEAGFAIPSRHPAPVRCSFAGVPAWLDWAKLPGNRFYFSSRNGELIPKRGDIVVYDGVFDPGPHDHIGVVLAVEGKGLCVAEGNVNDVSAVLWRARNHHIRGYIHIPNDYQHADPDRKPSDD